MQEDHMKHVFPTIVCLGCALSGFLLGTSLNGPLHNSFTTSHQGALILRQNTRTGETWYLDAGNRWHKITEPL